jgi:hypothetical protein
MMRLVLKWFDESQAYDLVPGLNTVGRNPTNDVRIGDPSVSSFHAEILFENNTVLVRDLGSTNGTFIDEVRKEEALITPENVLRLGNVRLVIDEVAVAAVCPVPASNSTPVGLAVELPASCAFHGEVRAAYRCENCGGAFCAHCVKVVGQGKFCAITICPMCHAQCYQLPSTQPEPEKAGLLKRLSQTLKLPFSH